MKCHSFWTRGRSVAVYGVASMVSLIMPAWAATRTHVYNLNGNCDDALGGPAIVTNGGWLGASGYHFFDGKGLMLKGTVPQTNYSVAMVFYIKDIANWKKLIDFKNLSSDNGLYSLGGRGNFYPVRVGDEVVFHTNGTLDHVVLTRDGLSQEVICYVNGVRQLGFVDVAQDAVFSSTDAIMHMFTDDAVTGGAESPRGFVDRIEIFEGAMTPAEAAAWSHNLPPRLSINRLGNGIAICWTNTVFGYEPEVSTAVSGGASWMPVLNGPLSNGLAETLVITNYGSVGSSFFRLRRR